MVRRRQEEDAPQGAPDWVVTYTDMISLLVTFFVLLMTYSSLEPRDFVKIGALLDTHEGILSADEGDVAPTFTEHELVSNQDPLRGAEIPHSRPPEHLVENLEEMGQRESPDHRPVDLSKVPDGLRIEFGAECSFEPGSAEVAPELARSLALVAEVLQHYSYLVVVEGFTDDRFRPAPGHADADDLSVERARNAARVILERTGLRPELLQIAGLGAEQPRATNVTPAGRRLNRRVQLRVLALSTTRQALLDGLEASAEGGR